MDGHVIDTRIEVKRPISSEEGNRLTSGGGMSLLTKQFEIKRLSVCMPTPLSSPE